jgi:hypothetical protein
MLTVCDIVIHHANEFNKLIMCMSNKSIMVSSCFSSHCLDLCISLTYIASTDVHMQYSLR